MKEFYRHFHIHEVPCPSVTFYVVIDDAKEEMRLSWAVCSPNDNFSRKVGRTLAKQNMEGGLFLKGKRHGGIPLYEDIYDIIKDSTLPKKDVVGPKKFPEDFRRKALEALEAFHFTEAFLEDVKQKDETCKGTFYWEVFLPFVFKSKFMQRQFWG